MEEKVYFDLMNRFEASSLTKLEVEEDGFRIRMEKGAVPAPGVIASGVAPAAAETTPVGIAPAMPTSVPAQAVPESPAGCTPVKAPLVGIFYSAPAPDDAPYVELGGRVEKGQILCLIEAMKMMNALRSPVDGVIRAIHGTNGQLAEYGEVLFEVEPC